MLPYGAVFDTCRAGLCQPESEGEGDGPAGRQSFLRADPDIAGMPLELAPPAAGDQRVSFCTVILLPFILMSA